MTATGFAYRFADVTVRSDVELPGLTRAMDGATPDVTVTIRDPGEPDDCTELGKSVTLPDGTFVMDLPPVARFHVDTRGSEIVVEPFFGASESALRHVVVDIALSRWLAAVGRPAVHATAVAVNGEVIAFLGASGRGKSTLSGAMVASGAEWVADDLLLLDLDGPRVRAVPTVVSTRLRPDSADALCIEHGQGEIIWGRESKRRWDVPAATDTLPLAGMFFLDRRDETTGAITISTMSNGEVIEELAAHWLLTDTGLVAPRTFFTAATRLLRTVPMRRLSYPSSFDELPLVIAAIRETIDLQSPLVPDDHRARPTPATAGHTSETSHHLNDDGGEHT